MNKKVLVALASTLGAIGLHSYLTVHYYKVKLGLITGQTLCDASGLFDCNAVSASSYSALFGIPMAAYGAVANFILLGFLLVYSLGWTDEPDKYRRYSLYFAAFIALVSVVMATISTVVVQNMCLFCALTYVASFITLAAVWMDQEEGAWKHFAKDFLAIFSSEKGVLVSLVTIPILAFIVHKGMMRNFDAGSLDRIVRSSVLEWKASPAFNFDIAPMLSKGPKREDAKIVITEFADFLCSHCATAAPTLEAFAKSHHDVRMEFYVFPLDGACNEDIPRANGLSCHLAKAVLCSEKTAQSGWPMHDYIFTMQQELGRGTIESINELLKKHAENQQMDWTKIASCIDQEETHAAIQRMAKLGANTRLSGTPTIFADGKKLPRGQLIPVLKGAYDTK